MSEATLFERAIAISSPTERKRFVEKAFAGRPGEMERFLRLLAANDEEDEVIDHPPNLAETELRTQGNTSDEIGKTIGPYKLLQRIGQGGFGVVYLAEETQTINRRVALKIIKPGMGSKEVIARFEAERQALAMMEHDNIARVFGGGTTDAGLPYFVMELVKGIPITDYCIQKKLAPEVRLRLFVSVCRGVQHAHQKGVIHRDLKPSNILVAEYDHHPVVKIIDFGVAKALNQRLTEQTLFTHYGSVIGTVQYMSPEQAKFNQLDVDTRSDVYSLGAVLYELLTGDTPLSKERVRSASFEEVIRWIREEEPSKPSTKVGLSAIAVGASKDAQHTNRRLSRLIRGDLDWIVMKALEKDRDRRYEAASVFADDLQRYLDQEPVLASPPSMTYRLSKFVRRHQMAVASATVMAVSLLIGAFLVQSWRITRIDNDRIRAENKAKDLELDDSRRKQRQQQNLQEVEDQTIPRIEDLIQSNQLGAAFELLKQVSREFPEHARLQELMLKASSRWSIRTEPAGARVSFWDYADPESEPLATAVTPAQIDLSKAAYRYRIELDGFTTADGFAGPDSASLNRKLDANASIPPGMVRVPASLSAGISDDYWIDRFEVTNRQFKEFVDNGGYGNVSLWSAELGLANGGNQAIAGFVDQTGQPGPRYWKNGSYLPGTADLPVVGICWAEATAYAKASLKQLPTVQHWNHACGEESESTIVPKSNLRSGGLMPVGQSAALGPYGTLDMFGNAAEWCFNAYGESSRIIAGNSFNGPEYGVGASTPMQADAREDFVGFRCMLTLGPRQEQLYVALEDERNVPFDGRQPVDDLRYEALRATYNYDQSLPLNEHLETAQNNAMPGIRHENYSLNAAYGERMFVHIFRPNGPIPADAQILVFMPGAGGFTHSGFAGSEAPFITTLVGTGRILAIPIIDGMYERKRTPNNGISPSHDIAKQIKDIRRGVDFLKASSDYGHAKFGFVGNSYGARLGPIACALEPRFQCAIYLAGGISRSAQTPEYDTVNFAPRALQPAIMINGTGDHTFPLESSQKPMFDLLGAPEGMKEHHLIEGGHSVQFRDLSKDLDQFLNRYLGPINRSPRDWRQQFASFDNQAAVAWSNRDPTSSIEFLLKQISLIQEHGSDADAELLAETRLRLGIVNNNPQVEVELYRQAAAEAQAALGSEHRATRRMRTALAYALTRSSIHKILQADDTSEPSYAAGKRELAEVEHLIPAFAWSQLGFAAAAIREGKNTQTRQHLENCEHLPFTWNLEFSIRALLAARDGNMQEARDWLTANSLEMTRHYQEGSLPRSDRFIAEVQGLKASSNSEAAISSDPAEAVPRLLSAYPKHYYLHWLTGYLAVRNSAMKEAHGAFQIAFDLCPGSRATDWLAITSKWHNDHPTLQKCHQRLIELAHLKDGGFMWDGVHMARVYCLTKSDNDYTQDEVDVFRAHVERARWFSRGKTAETTLGWLNYRLGDSVRIVSFTHRTNPEEQAESMVLDAITEYRFGSQSTAFDKLAAAREFISQVLPVPNGPAFKYVDSEHAWCAAHLLLREADSLTDLQAEDLASHVANAVQRLQSELKAKFGEENSEKMLLLVRDELIKHNEKVSSTSPGVAKDD